MLIGDCEIEEYTIYIYAYENRCIQCGCSWGFWNNIICNNNTRLIIIKIIQNGLYCWSLKNVVNRNDYDRQSYVRVYRQTIYRIHEYIHRWILWIDESINEDQFNSYYTVECDQDNDWILRNWERKIIKNIHILKWI